MLPSLHIQGFRCFRELTIERLGRVNLIVGKNNVGKTTLLDALRVYAAWRGALFELQAMLDRRGEIVRMRNRTNSSRRVVDWRRAFHEFPRSIVVAPFGKSSRLDEPSRLEFRPEQEMTDNGVEYSKISLYGHGLIGEFLLDSIPWGGHANEPFTSANDSIPCSQIPSSLLPTEQSSRLWDDIVLTPHEETCLQALRIIEPDIQRVALVDVPGADGMVERAPHVLRESRSQPEPLRSLGEGMNRLFDITLGMVNAREGRLLIDEIENGLHYSTHEKLWRYVFEVASALDVQVFATTHSWGCIDAFQAAARAHPDDGILIRLDRRESESIAYLFDEDELAVVSEQAIEVR